MSEGKMERMTREGEDAAEPGFWEQIPEVDAVVVLGEQVEEGRGAKEGKILPTLESKMRALAGLEIYNRGKARKIVVLGGRSQKFPSGPAISETIKEYLVARGVPEEDIITETESVDTMENLENLFPILEKENFNKVIFETSEYHTGRTAHLLRNILKKHGFATDDAPVLSAESVLRERSEHYKDIVEAYEFPSSLKNAPVAAVKKGLHEYLHRGALYIDCDGKAAKFIADKTRKFR